MSEDNYKALVARLRAPVPSVYTAKDAADAIEALMAERGEYEDLTLKICFDKVVKDRDAYKARAERAEAALRTVLPYAEEYEDEGPIGEGWKSFELTKIIEDARAVLAQIKGTGSPEPENQRSESL